MATFHGGLRTGFGVPECASGWEEERDQLSTGVHARLDSPHAKLGRRAAPGVIDRIPELESHVQVSPRL